MRSGCAAALELLREHARRNGGGAGGTFLRKAWRFLPGRIRRHREALFAKKIRAAFRTNRITCVVLDLPAFRGVFEVLADSSLALMCMRGDFDPLELALIARLVRTGDSVVDVGANAGLYTVLLSSLAGPDGRVLAVEPSPAILPGLKRNLERNRAANVALHEGLLAETDGEREFHSVDRSPEYSSLGAVVHPHAPKESTKVVVRSTTLDAIVDNHGLKPSFIKIDVEGAEGLVLAGARETLRTCRPSLLLEVDDRLLQTLGHTSSSVFGSLEESEYRILSLADGAGLDFRQGGTYIGSVLALPAEHFEGG